MSEAPGVQPLVDAYRSLLGALDTWFNTVLAAAPPGMLACRAGCSACCRGLFDITLLDALLLRQGFALLPAATRDAVLARCRPRLAELQRRWPQLRPPYLLNELPDDDWTEMPEDDETPCPLLGEGGLCLLYAYRPMTCRLHGLPNLDLSGEDFTAELCSLHGADPRALPASLLRWPFRDTFRQEFSLLQECTRQLIGTPTTEADTFIPLALLADYAAVAWRRSH